MAVVPSSSSTTTNGQSVCTYVVLTSPARSAPAAPLPRALDMEKGRGRRGRERERERGGGDSGGGGTGTRERERERERDSRCPQLHTARHGREATVLLDIKKREREGKKKLKHFYSREGSILGDGSFHVTFPLCTATISSRWDR